MRPSPSTTAGWKRTQDGGRVRHQQLEEPREVRPARASGRGSRASHRRRARGRASRKRLSRFASIAARASSSQHVSITHQSQDLSRLLWQSSQILRETHSSEVPGTPYAHKCVSRLFFVVVERLGMIWTCFRVLTHSRACVSDELISGCVIQIRT